MAHTRTDVEFRAQGDVTLRSWLYQPEGVDTVPKSAPWTNTPKALLALLASAEHAAQCERLSKCGILLALGST